MLTFIHCADLHLDQPFRGLGKVPRELGQKLQQVNHGLLPRIVSTAIEEKVDVVIIAGDTFHQAVPTIQTQQQVITEFERLNQANIQVVLSFGNHDFYQAATYWFDFPSNVYCFTTEAVTTQRITLANQETVAFSGFSYEGPVMTAAKVLEFPHRDPEVTYHIGVYHGQVGQLGDHPYAPFQGNQMQALGYDYWALGHIHQGGQVGSDPRIVYPGTPVGHRRNETQTKGVVLGTISQQQLTHEWLPQSPLSWHVESVNCDQVTTSGAIVDRIEEQISQVWQQSEGLKFVSLALVNIPETFAATVAEQLQTGELLAYLQTRLYQLSQGQCWVHHMTTSHPLVDTIQWPLGTRQETLLDLVRPYQEKEALRPLLAPLFRQVDLGQLIDDDEAFALTTLNQVYQELGLESEGGQRNENQST